jgi:hypothetical protein
METVALLGAWDGRELLDPSLNTHSPETLAEAQAKLLRDELAKVQPALISARKLLDFPEGRFPPYQWTLDYFATIQTHQLDTRQVVDLLRADAMLKCHQRDLPGAWNSVIGMVHAGRSLGDEAAGLSQFTRLAIHRAVVDTCERILGRGELSEPALTRMRELLAEERKHSATALFIRAERAGQHRFYTNLECGVVDLAMLANAPRNEFADRMWRNYVASGQSKRSHAFTLRTLNRYAHDMKLPEPNNLQSIAELEKMARAGELGPVPALASLLMPAVGKIAYGEKYSKLQLSCAIIALAAETFHLRSHRWPRDVDELQSTGLLEAIPQDPYWSFDPKQLAKPLRLRHAADGIVVHSVVAPRDYQGDGRDDLTALTPHDWESKQCPEFRLWNPPERRRPPARLEELP